MSMMKIRELFPTKWSFFIFIAYMALFINQGILVTASKTKQNTFTYNSVTVVLLVEVTKLITSSLLFLAQHQWQVSVLVQDFVKQSRALLLYMVPSGLYCVYNVLTFTNLAAFDPTTYFLLLQLRVVVTGVLFQVLFQRQLSGRQWASLLLLTTGCIVKQLDFAAASSAGDAAAPWYRGIFSFNIVLILAQVFCSCFAGVYNEFLLKKSAASVHIMLQNMFMYCDSIVCALVALLLQGQLAAAMTPEAISSILQPGVLAIVANNAAIGIVTSFFLQQLNSILKTFASALELLFTALLCWAIFGIPVHANTVLAIGIVSVAVWTYSQQPVHNPPPPPPPAADPEAAEPLIQES